MHVLRKLRGFLVFSTLCLISPGRGRLWSPCLAGDCGTVVLNEGLNRQKQCSLYLGGDGLTKTQPRKKSKIICICLGWRYSPVAEIYASFPQERNKGEEKRSLPGADKTEGHRVELLAMWGIFARKNTYRGCSTLSILHHTCLSLTSSSGQGDKGACPHIQSTYRIHLWDSWLWGSPTASNHSFTKR